MCGIVGKFNFTGEPISPDHIIKMCRTLIHRGPDDEGVYTDDLVGLGIRRLSIIDVAGGHQPLSNEDKTIWIVFNGEIYNYPELNKWLKSKGHSFTTNTDTEAIIHLYEEMGDECVKQLNGMFAFAIWDSRKQKMLLARDRLGKKPLHYMVNNNRLIFSSEIPPILEDPSVERSLDIVALQQYLRLWFVPSPRTMFEGIRKLPPAHFLVCENARIRIERYWDVDFSQKQSLTDTQWGEKILGLLDDAVRIRLMSDVPLGAFLSGGVDSSTVVSLMSRFINQPVKTFSIGFEDINYNELPYARQVARYLGTEHHEEIIKPDAAKILPKLVWHYGEPFGDDSCIPSYYVSKMARQYVTVALSGDGGDENFGGYPRIPHYLSFNPVNSIRGLLIEWLKGIFYQGKQQNSLYQRGFINELAFRVGEILDPMERYTHEWLVWDHGISGLLTPDLVVTNLDHQVLGHLDNMWSRTKEWDPIDRLLYLEIMTYLPDDLQVKFDIASMAASLEVRSPLLDYRLVELAASMPSNLKFRDGESKYLFKKVVGPLLPQMIPNRLKQGFSMPIGNWLRNELRPMVENLLLDPSTKRGIFKDEIIRDMVRRHLSGNFDYGRHLWLLLNFEIWYDTFL